jgi:hypothetical protein
MKLRRTGNAPCYLNCRTSDGRMDSQEARFGLRMKLRPTGARDLSSVGPAEEDCRRKIARSAGQQKASYIIHRTICPTVPQNPRGLRGTRNPDAIHFPRIPRMGADRPTFISVIRAIRGRGFFKSFGCGFAALGSFEHHYGSIAWLRRIPTSQSATQHRGRESGHSSHPRLAPDLDAARDLGAPSARSRDRVGPR